MICLGSGDLQLGWGFFFSIVRVLERANLQMTKLGRTENTLEDRSKIQKHLDR